MNIHDGTGMWKVEHGQITNLRTGKVKQVTGIPDASYIASVMPSHSFTGKCAVAFQTGKWPMTRRVCAYCRQERFEP